MHIITQVILAVLSASHIANAEKTPTKTAPGKPISKVEALEKTLQHLRSSGFETEFRKKIKDIMDRDIESSGDMFFSGGKIRIEQSKPDKTLLVYDGKVAWQEQAFDDGDTKKIIVTKMRNVRKSSAILGALLSDRTILSRFKITKHTKNEKTKYERYELIPKDAKIAEVKKLRIDFENDRLKGISYVDDISNQVTYFFDSFKEKEVSPKKFEYKPPKGAEVSEV